jgi:hypothetical protein
VNKAPGVIRREPKATFELSLVTRGVAQAAVSGNIE